MKFAANQAGNSKKNTILAAIILAVITLFTGSVKAASAATASFVGLDTTTRGSWQTKYGADGYAIPNLSQSIPSYATFAPQNAQLYTWNPVTVDGRAVKMPNSGAGIASTFYSSSFALDINAADGNTHQIAVYVLDWDSNGARSQTMQVIDANSNAVLDTENVANFANGTYVIWNVTGHVHINVSCTGGANAVIAGVFFGKNSTAAAAASSTATFAGADTSTQGNWQGKYGVDGYSISNSAQTLPAYASFGVQNQMNYTWNPATSDTRALQIPNSAARMAATWYNAPSFNFDVNLTDGNSHRVALYAIDWDGSGSRAQTVQVVDAASSKVLDTESISGFSSGMYLVWNVTGHVKINVTMTGARNAVISGIFFDSNNSNNNASAPAAPKTTAPVSTAVLSASTSALSFGSVQVSGSSVQNVTLTNTGNANVTISNVSLSGAGFAAAGLSTGTVIAPGQSATMQATLTPAMAGKVTGSITVSSNATNGTNVIALSGTGIAQTTHSVSLNWAPSTSQVAGYNVYVSTTEGGAYAKLTGSPVANTSFVDSGLQTAQTRYYVVTSVDSSNNESAFSSPVSAIVP